MIRPLALVFGAFFLLGAAEKPPSLLRIHLQAPEGAKGQSSIPVTLFDPAQNIAIQTVPEVTEKDIRTVLGQADGTTLVSLDDFGRTKLEMATSTGRGLILVVIVNSRVVYAPLIDTSITNGAIILPAGAIFPEELEAFNREAAKKTRN